MSVSLLDFARQPEAVPCPLPPLDTRRRAYGSATGWAVGLLPFEAIAVDLGRLGVAYRHGIGYSRLDERLDADDVARLAADVLADAAMLLPEPPLRVAKALVDMAEAWRIEAGRAALDSLRELRAEGHTIDVPPGAWIEAPTTLPAMLQARAYEALTTADPTAQDWASQAFALRATADDLRVSARARSSLLSGLRSHLDAPAVRSSDVSTAERFLADLDARELLLRSELSFLYAEAGSPGGLTPAGLRELAADRWGDPKKVRGNYVHRPARATPPAPACEVVQLADVVAPANLSAARDYAVGRYYALGSPPPVELLVEVFDLLPSDARALLAEVAA